MGKYLGNKPSLAEAEYLDWVPISKVVLAGHTFATFSNITDDFDEYKFEFINIHPGTNATILSFQVNAVGATGFNETITSGAFESEHNEAGDSTALQYRSNRDQDEDTAYQQLGEYIYSDSAEKSGSGELILFDPSSAYHKHWYSTFQAHGNAVSQVSYHAGYINTTTAIDEIKFIMTANDMTASGIMEAGKITMYGLSK